MAAPDPASPPFAKTVIGQVLFASFWTILAIGLFFTNYCYANEFLGISFFGTGHELRWHRPDLEMAQIIADESTLFLAGISMVMFFFSRRLGGLGLLSCLPLLFYYCIPRF